MHALFVPHNMNPIGQSTAATTRETDTHMCNHPDRQTDSSTRMTGGKERKKPLSMELQIYTKTERAAQEAARLTFCCPNNL